MAELYEVLDVGDPYKTESEWCDTAFTFDLSGQASSTPVTFREWFEKQNAESDPSWSAYSRCVFVYAARWARRVENAVRSGEALSPALLRRAGHEADRGKGMGITGMQHGAAVSILAQTWIHGAALLRWQKEERGAK